MKREAWPRLLLLLLGFLLAFVIVEAALQGASLIYRLSSVPRASTPPLSGGDSGKYTVLCLGESTTAHFLGVRGYTDRLSELLDERGYPTSFQVVNAGFVSVDSGFLVEKLPGLIEEHTPDMVILMMGVNDSLYFDDPTGWTLPLDVQLALLHSRTYRLMRILA